MPTKTPSPTPHPEEKGVFIFDTKGENLQRLLIGDYNLPKFSLDGQKIFMVETDGEKSDLLVYDRKNKEISFLYSVQGEIKNIEVAPEKTALALLSEHEQKASITLFDYKSIKEIASYSAPDDLNLGGNFPYLSWSYDAIWLAFTQCDYDQYGNICQILLWDVGSGTEPVNLNTLVDGLDDALDISVPVWSPKDSRLAFVQEVWRSNTNVYIVDFQQSPPELLSLDLLSNLGLLWSPDASQLLVDGMMAPFVVDIEAKTKTMLFNGGLGIYYFVGWLPDGKTIYHTIASYSGTGSIHFFDPVVSDPRFSPSDFITDVSKHSPNLSFSMDEIVFIGVYDPTIPHPWD